MADLLTPRTLGRLIAMCSPARRCAYSAPSTSTAASCNITVYEQRAACNLQHTTCSATRLSLLSHCTLPGAATGQHPDACSMLYAYLAHVGFALHDGMHIVRVALHAISRHSAAWRSLRPSPAAQPMHETVSILSRLWDTVTRACTVQVRAQDIRSRCER